MIDEYDVLHTLSTKKPHCSRVTNGGGELPRAQGGGRGAQNSLTENMLWLTNTQQVEYDKHKKQVW